MFVELSAFRSSIFNKLPLVNRKIVYNNFFLIKFGPVSFINISLLSFSCLKLPSTSSLKRESKSVVSCTFLEPTIPRIFQFHLETYKLWSRNN